jgi:hypothetical protein
MSMTRVCHPVAGVGFTVAVLRQRRRGLDIEFPISARWRGAIAGG